ncbi:MAG: exodeoxyribonuclease VII large subunit [Rhabdochlamydiaceae bacterium]|nr:exodeoxyribonuclease VII large subunit [Rhabdochlamydiaceae bacterium]
MRKVLSVSELTYEIKKQLESNLCSICVRGEAINVKLHSSGHLYFTLKDAQSQISAVLFKGALRGTGEIPKEGNQITVFGEITVYPPKGNYQILVRSIEYVGEGALLAKLQERKKQMQALGYFDASRKKKLPKFPKTIGVITSPTGAVIQDILQILQRRHAGFHLILSPVKVQGDGAKQEIAKAIDQFNAHGLADVLIVGRGGGSLEDLWAFNEEEVVQAILRSRIPIVSAVGHETDFSLSDFVADVRAPTPSAAAELVIAEKELQKQHLDQYHKQIHRQELSLLLRLKQLLQSRQKNPYIISPYLLLSKKLQQIDDSKMRLFSYGQALLKQKKTELISLEKQKNLLEPSYQIRQWKEKYASLQKRLDYSWIQIANVRKKLLDPEGKKRKLALALEQVLQKKKQNLVTLISHLQSIDPKNLLTKGYCILFSENKNSVILSTKELAAEQTLRIQMKDGQIKAKVEEIL